MSEASEGLMRDCQETRKILREHRKMMREQHLDRIKTISEKGPETEADQALVKTVFLMFWMDLRLNYAEAVAEMGSQEDRA